MLISMNSIVLPGDVVEVGGSALGPGLWSGEGKEVQASVAGVVRGEPKKKAWVDHNKKRYVPLRDERVLGVVAKTGRQHRVDIGSSSTAVLPELAFQGATKRNKPNLQVGEVVYCRVSRAHRAIEAEISCVEGSGKAGGLGPLPPSPHSNLFHCSLGLCRNSTAVLPELAFQGATKRNKRKKLDVTLRLLQQHCPAREALGKYFKFECVVGMNGRVWVDSNSIVHTIAITNALLKCEFMSDAQCHEMVAKLMDRL